MADDVESTVKALQGLSPADQAAMMPETFANPLVKKKIDDLAHVVAMPGNAMTANNGNMLPTEDLIRPATDMALQFGAIGVPMAEPGTAGIFGGKLSRTADQAMLEKGHEMAEQGFNPVGIRKATGWHPDQTGLPSYEIPDNKSYMLHPNGTGPLSAMFQHNEVFKAYPELKDVRLRSTIDPTLKPGQGSGYWHPETGEIGLNSPTAADARAGALHEINHVIQHIEGFSPGTTPNVFEKLLKEHPDLIDAIPGEVQTPFGMYHKTAGEVNARNVETRRDFSPLQRQGQAPWDTWDVPLKSQIKMTPFDPREILPKSMLPLDLQSHPIVNALKNK